jgi:hypothetical protein
MTFESKIVDIQEIKSLNVKQIEDAFSKALESLTGSSYKVNISKLNFDGIQNASYIELSLTSEAPF